MKTYLRCDGIDQKTYHRVGNTKHIEDEQRLVLSLATIGKVKDINLIQIMEADDWSGRNYL